MDTLQSHLSKMMPPSGPESTVPSFSEYRPVENKRACLSGYCMRQRVVVVVFCASRFSAPCWHSAPGNLLLVCPYLYSSFLSSVAHCELVDFAATGVPGGEHRRGKKHLALSKLGVFSPLHSVGWCGRKRSGEWCIFSLNRYDPFFFSRS